jgi:glycosyltransferase involved in cell wall biosynthesis
VSVWHIITGEYPPQPGGVSDYTRLIATGLVEKGMTVHVWAPAFSLHGDGLHRGHAVAPVQALHCDDTRDQDCCVIVHRLPGHFGIPAIATLTRALCTIPPGCVLVQYVPHAFGYKAMNLPLCLWLNSLREKNLIVMFHEVAFPLGRAQPARHNLLGAVTRLMAWLVSRRAKRILVASAQWELFLRRLGATAPVSWVPVPSNVPVVAQPDATATLRRRYVDENGLLLGHFANYSNYSAGRLSQTVPALLASNPRLSLLLVGAHSHDLRARLINQHPSASLRIFSTGVLQSPELSCALAACELMVQPYPDGVSTRRGSVAALLAHRRVIVTTSGAATEALWSESGAVALAPSDDPAALRNLIGTTIRNQQVRHHYERAGAALYESRFALRHTIAALLNESVN